MTNTNAAGRQIRDTFVKAERYGVKESMDTPLAEIIGGIRHSNSGITEELFRYWRRADARDKDVIEQTFFLLTDRKFEDFVDAVHQEISKKAEEKLFSELPPRPFPAFAE